MPIQFKFIKIEVPQFAILVEEVVNGPFRIGFEVSFALGGENIIKCSLKIVYLKETQPVTQLVVDTFFEVESSSWKELESEGKIVVPAGFLQHIAALTLSTARGIQYAKTVEMGINNYIIPLTNLTEIIKEDLVIENSDLSLTH